MENESEIQPQPCVCLAMLIADKVFREEATRKVHIAGTFSMINAKSYPALHNTMHLYLALTNVMPGEHKGKVRFVYLDDEHETELLRMEGPIVAKDELEVVELNFCFRQIIFPRPGTLEIRFHLDNQHISRRTFQLIKREE